MGTSSAYGGPGSNTPLVPTWLDPGEEPVQPLSPEPAPSGGDEDDGAPEQNGPPGLAPLPVPPAIPARFQGPRNSFTRFARSGGRDLRNLGRAVSGYVSTGAGGPRNAARRMRSSRAAGAKLLGFLSDVLDRGAPDALRALNLEGLAGRPIEEIFLGLVDYVCPEGGGVDEGIARDAFIETVADVAELGITDLDGLTADQMQTIFELYATHAIEARIYNDVGPKGVILPSDIAAVERVQAQLHDFIQRGVADALSVARDTLRSITPDRVLGFVGEVYEAAFAILRTLGEAEAAK